MILALATGLGTGSIPKAPGTFGSLLGLALAWGIGHLSFWSQVVAAAGVFLVGIPICERGARLLGLKDPGAVVFDEIAAFPTLFLFVPFGPASAVLGFLLFRVFDITKPWPACRLEKLPGGLGIMADDLMAGIYAGAGLWCIARWFPLG